MTNCTKQELSGIVIRHKYDMESFIKGDHNMKNSLFVFMAVTLYFVPVPPAFSFEHCSTIMSNKQYTRSTEREPWLQIAPGIVSIHSGDTKWCTDKGSFNPIISVQANYSQHNCLTRVGSLKVFAQIEPAGNPPSEVYGKA